YRIRIAAPSSPCQGWDGRGVCRHMLLALLLSMQSAPAREAPPVLAFPTAGLDDPAAYEGYTARLYRDSRGNSVEIYIEGTTGRMVHLWADALNESIGFTVRPAAVAFAEGGATAAGRTVKPMLSFSASAHRWTMRPVVPSI